MQTPATLAEDAPVSRAEILNPIAVDQRIHRRVAECQRPGPVVCAARVLLRVDGAEVENGEPANGEDNDHDGDCDGHATFHLVTQRGRPRLTAQASARRFSLLVDFGDDEAVANDDDNVADGHSDDGEVRRGALVDSEAQDGVDGGQQPGEDQHGVKAGLGQDLVERVRFDHDQAAVNADQAQMQHRRR